MQLYDLFVPKNMDVIMPDLETLFRRFNRLLGQLADVGIVVLCLAAFPMFVFGVCPLIEKADRDGPYGVYVGVICAFHVAVLITFIPRVSAICYRRLFSSRQSPK